jgi:zinc protease
MNAIYDYYQTGINSADPKNYEDILNNLTPKDIQKFAKALYNKKTDIVDIVFKPKAK